MADDVREYLRAAQQAELRGDSTRAVEMLQKAARLYRAEGNSTRALSVLKHAHRLDRGRTPSLEREMKRLEWRPENALAEAMDAHEEVAPALAPLEELAEAPPAGDRGRVFVERGPELADPTLQAW